MNGIPDPNAVYPNEYHTSCFLKNVITAPNIQVGEYTYYDGPVEPTGFERNNVLYNGPEFGDRLIIGRFCSIASGARPRPLRPYPYAPPAARAAGHSRKTKEI